jgi:hypothetical protein
MVGVIEGVPAVRMTVMKTAGKEGMVGVVAALTQAWVAAKAEVTTLVRVHKQRGCK